MDTRRDGIFSTWFMFAMMLAAHATFAQDAGDLDTVEPDVDSPAVIVDELGTSGPAAAASPVLAPDVTRRASGSEVMDSIELGRSEITGNQELPKVMYIVPWQKSESGDLMGRPVNTLLDEVLAPLDREEFTRKVDYYNDLYGDEDE